MKAAVLKGVKKIELEEIEEPKLEENKVMIEIKKTGICGSDIHNWDLGMPEGLVMGHEFCGVVINPGDRKDLNVGDRVTALPISPCGKCEACLNGNHQYCQETWAHAVGLSLDNPGGLTKKINVRSDMVIKVPDSISDNEVAMVEPTAVGLHGVNLANIKIGDKVLVVGGGIIGLVSALFAKKAGASYVAVSEPNMARAMKALELGVIDEYFNPLNDMEKMSQKGFDVVLECCGNEPAVTSALMTVKPGGIVVLVGVSAQPINVPTVIAVMHELTVKGAIAYTIDEFKTCIDLINNKEIDVMKFVSEVTSLENVQSSYEKLTSNESDAIKILIEP